jgi:protein-disulfide isomerase
MNHNKYDPFVARHGPNIILLLCLSVIWFMAIPVLGTWDIRAAESAQTMSNEEFNRRVREYLINNPEVLAEAMDRLEAREKKAQQLAVKTVLKERAGELLQDPNSPVGGNAKGNVTLVEFFDYNCSYCRRVAPTMTKLMAGDPQLRVVYKEFPILGPDSLFAAKAALAAQLQDKYVPFHKAIMNRKGKVDEKFTLAAAAKMGLDVARLKKDMEAPEIAAAIEKNFKLAQALGINGTPGFVIGNQIIPGATDLKTLKTAVEQARGKRPKK